MLNFPTKEEEEENNSLSSSSDASNSSSSGLKFPTLEEEEKTPDTQLEKVRSTLASKYGGDIEKLASYSDSQIKEYGSTKNLNEATINRLRDLAKAYRLTNMVKSGDLKIDFLRDKEKMESLSNSGIYNIFDRAFKDVEYNDYLESDGEQGASTSQMLFPEYSRRSETGSGFSKFIGGVDDVLSMAPRALRSGISAATSDDKFTEEMARPDEYKTGGQAVFDEFAQPNFLLNAPIKGAIKGIYKGGRKLADVGKNIDRGKDIANIVKKGAGESTLAQKAGQGIVNELPVAAQEALFQGTDEDGGVGAGVGTLAANLLGSAAGNALSGGIKKAYKGRLNRGLNPDDIPADEMVSATGYDRFRDAISDELEGMTYAERARYVSGDKARSELDKAVTQSDEIVKAGGEARKKALEGTSYAPDKINMDATKSIIASNALKADKVKALKIIEDVTNQPITLSKYLDEVKPEKYTLGNYLDEGLGKENYTKDTKWKGDFDVEFNSPEGTNAADLIKNRTNLRKIAKQGSGKEMNVDIDQNAKDLAYSGYKDATDKHFKSTWGKDQENAFNKYVGDEGLTIDGLVEKVSTEAPRSKTIPVADLYADIAKGSSIKTGNASEAFGKITPKAAKLPDMTDGSAVDKYIEKISSSRMNPKKLKGTFKDMEAEQARINKILKEAGKDEVDYISPAVAARVARSGDFKTFLENTTGVEMSASAVKKIQKAVTDGLKQGSAYGIRAMNAAIDGITRDMPSDIPSTKKVKSQNVKAATKADNTEMSDWQNYMKVASNEPLSKWQKYVEEKGGTITAKDALGVE